MNFFDLNDHDVDVMRQHHSILKGKKLIDSGKFSGIFESHKDNTVLKLSIDEASYCLNTDSQYQPLNQHFVKLINDFGIVGTYTLKPSKLNLNKTVNPQNLQVPIYLYEIEKLTKIPKNSKNNSLRKHLLKDWKNCNFLSNGEDLHKTIDNLAVTLCNNNFYLNQDSIIEAIYEIASFVKQYRKECSFVDLHKSNIMQRDDETFVFSDPIGDFQIYSQYHHTYKSENHTTSADMNLYVKYLIGNFA